MDGMAGSAGEAIFASCAFLASATLGHAVVVAMLAPMRAKAFKARRWIFPLLCGLVFSIMTATGLVENSTDVVGDLTGHRHEYAILVGAVLAWSVLATGAMAGFERLLVRAKREKQIA
jgi:hypothetical protein